MRTITDGKRSSLFKPLALKGNISISELTSTDISMAMAKSIHEAPGGSCVCWGIPFEIEDPVLIKNRAVSVSFDRLKTPWLIFMHTSDWRQTKLNSSGFAPSYRGYGRLNEHEADYVILYANGEEERVSIKRRHQISSFIFGEKCFEAVSHSKPALLPGEADEMVPNHMWGDFQKLATAVDKFQPWLNWLWAWENPHPEKEIVGIRFEPILGSVLVFGITAGNVSSSPIRWEKRRKVHFSLPKGEKFNHAHTANGDWNQIQLDMGKVISIRPQTIYPNESWEHTYNNCLPKISNSQVLVEYTAHPEASFHFSDGRTVSLREFESKN